KRIGLGTRLAVEVFQGRHEEPLRISNVGITTVTSTSAIIAWETNRSTRGQVNWGETPSYGALQGTEGGQLFADAPTTSHSIALENLTPTKKYYFEVLATDLNGQQSFDAYYSFTTLESAVVD
ncbi:MAG: fibronectin type III domain-containing protein, partial [bacterium]|nr:fibronectin type III domain-containing protein [bacterium]